MKINVRVKETDSTHGEFAPVTISSSDTGQTCSLDLMFAPLHRRFGSTNSVALDFLFMSAVIYATDKLIDREKMHDAWTRDFEISLPVQNRALFSAQAQSISECVSFLTGDRWNISFKKCTAPLSRLKRRRRRSRRLTLKDIVQSPDAVCLFSGGADSLTGVVDWLEEHSKKQIVLVGHYDGDVKGPKSDQNVLYSRIAAAYPKRTEQVQIRVGQQPGGCDSNFRSRSLLFIALGTYVAQHVTGTPPLLMPENGTIAVNIPLSPSRRGSCSTRTAHPYYLEQVRGILDGLGLKTQLLNPLEFKTKGEILSHCKNLPLLKTLIEASCSCAKSGHTVNWRHRSAGHCGMCMPCIYRRAAMHSIGIDNQLYGRDVFGGELDIENDAKIANDFRACLSFLRRNLTAQEVAKVLIANGSLPLDHACTYANMVVRAMDEIRAVIRQKGTATIKRHAGIRAS